MTGFISNTIRHAISLALLAGPPLLAQTSYHFSHVTLKIPAGWTVSESNGWVQVVPPGVKAGQIVWIGVSQGTPSKRDLDEEFGTFVKGSANGMTTLGSLQLRSGLDLQRNKAVWQTVMLQDATGQRYMRLYRAVRNGDRFESMVFSSSDSDMAIKLTAAVENFFLDMVYDRPGQPAPK